MKAKERFWAVVFFATFTLAIGGVVVALNDFVKMGDRLAQERHAARAAAAKKIVLCGTVDTSFASSYLLGGVKTEVYFRDPVSVVIVTSLRAIPLTRGKKYSFSVTSVREVGHYNVDSASQVDACPSAGNQTTRTSSG